jgi:hypothetical protein
VHVPGVLAEALFSLSSTDVTLAGYTDLAPVMRWTGYGVRREKLMSSRRISAPLLRKYTVRPKDTLENYLCLLPTLSKNNLAITPFVSCSLPLYQLLSVETSYGINNAMSRTAELLTIAVFGIVVLSVFTSSLDSHLVALQLSPGVNHLIDVQRTRLAGIVIPMHVSNGVLIEGKKPIRAAQEPQSAASGADQRGRQIPAN